MLKMVPGAASKECAQRWSTGISPAVYVRTLPMRDQATKCQLTKFYLLVSLEVLGLHVGRRHLGYVHNGVCRCIKAPAQEFHSASHAPCRTASCIAKVHGEHHVCWPQWHAVE